MILNNFKKLFLNGTEMKKLRVNGIQIWSAIKNWVKYAIDTDGSIFNGTGYIENRRLSSNGGLSSSAQNGSVTTGFIPWYGDTTYLRMKGVEWKNATANHGGHYYINYYDTNKKFLVYLSAFDAPNYTHVVSVTRDANGIETVKWSETYGTSNTLLQQVRSAEFIRITAYGKGADMIVTLNEEIT
jgi:hypothetical protein